MTTPRRSRGKLVALWIAALGLALLVAAAVAFRWRIAEEYYLRKIWRGDLDEQVAAAEKLGEMRSVRAVQGIVAAFRWEVAFHLAHRWNLSTGNADSHIGERGLRLKKALVAIGKPATLELLRSKADAYTRDILLTIYADSWRELRVSAGPQMPTFELLLRRLESDPTQPEEVRKEAALALLRERRRQ